MMAIKTEHAGAKNGGGYWGKRAEAKRRSRRLRRKEGRKAIFRGLGEREGEAVNQLVSGKEDRVILSLGGRDHAVILPISYLEILDKIEDRWLQEKAKKAHKEKGEIPWGEVKKDLDL